MKRVIITTLILLFSISFAQAQNKKAEKEAAGLALFEKAKAAIAAKDFVIVPDSYEKSDGTPEPNTDDANFISYEGNFVFLQGMIICSNSFTNRTEVTSINQKEDKKGNIFIEMQVMGSAITAKVEISLRKGGNYAEVIVTPTKGTTRRFSGEILPRAESKYIKKPNVV